MRAPEPIRPPATSAGWHTGELWLLFGITLVALVVRLVRVEQWSMAAAEVATWQAVTMPLHGEHGFFASAAGQQPLVHLGLRWLLDAGVLPFHGEGWLRLPFVFAGTITVPLLALAAGLVAPARTALLAAGLLAVHPWHLAISQMAAPPVVAVAFALLAATAALAARGRWRRGRLLVAVLAAALACGSDRSGLAAVLMLVAGGLSSAWPPAGWGRRALWVAALLATAAVPAGLHAAGVWPFAIVAADAADAVPPWWSFVLAPCAPVVLLALLAPWVVRPRPVALLSAAAVAIGAFAAAAATGAAIALDDLAVVLLPLLVLAAAAAASVAAKVRAAAPGPATGVGAVTVPAAAATWLLVAAVLHATVFVGGRSPWRQAADLTLDADTNGRGIVVGARCGSASLTYYLRPNHWLDREVDPHPGIRVEHLAHDATAALGALFAAAAGRRVFVILRRDELESLQRDPGAEALLRGECQLLRVLPCPREHGDGTLYVFGSRRDG